MKRSRRNALKAVAASLLTPATGVLRAEDAYPNRPIVLLVPQPPGGDADRVCRTLQPHLQFFLRQPVVIENRSGASGLIGTALGAKAAADGHTVTFVNQSTMAINPHMFPNPGYSIEQFIPVTHLASVDLVICANPSLNVNDLQGLMSLVRNPFHRPINYGSAGNGSANHMAGELLKHSADLRMTHIPFRGGLPAILAAISGEIDIVVAFPIAVLQFLNNGKLKALAVTGAKRSTALPDVPTVAESGLVGYEFSSWFGFAVPKNTPDHIVSKLHNASVFALEKSVSAEKTIAEVIHPVGDGQKNFSKLIANESHKFKLLIEKMEIKPT